MKLSVGRSRSLARSLLSCCGGTSNADPLCRLAALDLLPSVRWSVVAASVSHRCQPLRPRMLAPAQYIQLNADHASSVSSGRSCSTASSKRSSWRAGSCITRLQKPVTVFKVQWYKCSKHGKAKNNKHKLGVLGSLSTCFILQDPWRIPR